MNGEIPEYNKGDNDINSICDTQIGDNDIGKERRTVIRLGKDRTTAEIRFDNQI